MKRFSAGIRWVALIALTLALVLGNVPQAAYAADAVDQITLYGGLASAIGAAPQADDGALNGVAWSANGQTMELYLTPAQLGFDEPLLVRDIEGISYQTKKSGGQGDVDWTFYIYTKDLDPDNSPWYGVRLNAEPYFAINPDAPANTWNTWSSREGKNQLRFFDADASGFYGTTNDPTLYELVAGETFTWPNGKEVAYRDREVLTFRLGTGSGWSSTFFGLLDQIEITAKGRTVIVDLQGQPADVFVDDNWTDKTPGEKVGEDLYIGSNAFATIQAAVDAVAEGGTVNVAEGTYAEQVVIDKPINLVGAGKESTTILAPATMPKSDVDSTIVLITANAEFSGFTVSGPGPSACGSIRAGIIVNNNANANIHDNAVKDIRDSVLSGCQNGVGIYVGRTTPGSATLTNNEFVGYQKGGIYVTEAGSYADLIDNVVTGPGTIDVIAQNGIMVGFGASATLSENEVSGHSYHKDGSDWDWGAAGVLLYQAGDVTFAGGNSIYANDTNVYVFDSGEITFGEESIGISSAPPDRGYAVTNDDANDLDLSKVSFGSYTNFEIEQLIYDRIDDPANGRAEWVKDTVFAYDDASLTAAVANAPAGSTIIVKEGTYAGPVMITKDLTLVGVGNPTIQAVDSMPACFTQGTTNYQAVVCVKDADATIEGFRIDGAYKTGTNKALNGILFNNAGGAIKNNDVQNVRNAPPTQPDDNPLDDLVYNDKAHGIFVYNDTAMGKSVEISGNLVANFSKNGIYVLGNNTDTNVFVTGNQVIGEGPTTKIAQNGIQVKGGNTTGKISGNNVSGLLYVNEKWVATGILVYSDVDVINNTITNGHNAIYIEDSTVTVSGNELQIVPGAGYAYGISIVSNHSTTANEKAADTAEVFDNVVRFVGNAVEGVEFYGIGIYQGTERSDKTLKADVHDNTVTGFTNGIGLTIESKDSGLLEVSADKNTLTGNETDFYIGGSIAESAIKSLKGNTIGTMVNELDYEVDATRNYWRGAGGPVAGAVTGEVNYTPWCADAACTRFLPVEGVIELPEEGTTPEDIQAAINNAPEGGTVIIPAGKFTIDGGFVVEKPGLKIVLSDGTVIQNNSPCFVVREDNVTIEAETFGGAKCVPTHGGHGIVVNNGVKNLVVNGVVIDGEGQETGDGIHFAGAITDVIIANSQFLNLDGDGIEFTAQPAGVVEIQGNLFKGNAGLGINAGGSTVNAEYNSWGANVAPVVGAPNGITAGVDADPYTYAALSVSDSTGTPWVNQVVNGNQITYTVVGEFTNVMGTEFTLAYDPTKLQVVGTPLLLDSFENEVIDTAADGTIFYRGYQMEESALTGTKELFTVTFKALATGESALNLVEATDVFAMAPEYGSTNLVYADSLTDGIVKVFALPALTSDNIAGPYVVGVQQEFQVTLDNPADGGDFAHVKVFLEAEGATLADIVKFEYLAYDASGNELGWMEWTLTPSEGGLVGAYGPAAGFPMNAPYNATSRFRVTFATAKTIPVTLTVVDVDTNTILATLEADEMDVREAPAFSSDDIAGPYFAGYTQPFNVTLTNPAGGLTFSKVRVEFRVKNASLTDIALIQYWETFEEDGQPTGWRNLPMTQDGADLVGYYGPSAGFPLPAPYNVTSQFQVQFARDGEYEIEFSLIDRAESDRVLTTFTTTAVVNPHFTVTGTISMQGRLDRSGVLVTLTGVDQHPFTYGPFESISTSLLSGNLSFAKMIMGNYTLTTAQERYLNVEGISVTISGTKTTLNPLELKGGNTDWNDNEININDASIVGSQYGTAGVTDGKANGDANFSGKVDIFDLALVGGNYGLNGNVYNTWIP